MEAAAEIMRRIDALAQGDRRHDPATAAAVLVDVPLPEIKLSGLLRGVRGLQAHSHCENVARPIQEVEEQQWAISVCKPTPRNAES